MLGVFGPGQRPPLAGGAGEPSLGARPWWASPQVRRRLPHSAGSRGRPGAGNLNGGGDNLNSGRAPAIENLYAPFFLWWRAVVFKRSLKTYPAWRPAVDSSLSPLISIAVAFAPGPENPVHEGEAVAPPARPRARAGCRPGRPISKAGATTEMTRGKARSHAKSCPQS
jgi:hypothetical protein